MNRVIMVGLLGSIFILGACQSKSSIEKTRTALKNIKTLTKINANNLWQGRISNGIGKGFGIFTPLVSGSVVFTGAADGTVNAKNIRTGKTIWQTNIGAKIVTDVGDGLNNIYVASDSGQVFGINKINGRLSMKTRVLGVINTTPVSSGRIIVTKTQDGKIYGLSLAGNIIWQQKHEPQELSVHRSARPVFFGASVILGLDDGSLMAINSNNGQIKWLEPISFASGRNIIERLTDLDATPVLEAKNLYVISYHGNLAKIDANTGDLLWSTKYSSVESPTIYNNIIIATHDEGLINAFDKYSGNKLWENSVFKGYNLSAPVIYNRYVAVGVKNSNRVFWLDGANGRLIAQSKVAGDKIMSLVASSYGAIVYTRNGKISLQRPF